MNGIIKEERKDQEKTGIYSSWKQRPFRRRSGRKETEECHERKRNRNTTMETLAMIEMFQWRTDMKTLGNGRHRRQGNRSGHVYDKFFSVN